MSEDARNDGKWPAVPGDSKAWLFICVAFVALWLFARSWNIYPLVYPGDAAPRLTGADSYFHLRHAEYCVSNFPHVTRQDRMTGFPGVERGLNQGGYDLFVAALSLVTFGVLTPLTIMVWISPLLTAAAGLLLARWLAREDSMQTALLFLLFLLAFPGPVAQNCSLGNGDHHAFEIFLSVLFFRLVDGGVKKRSPRPTALGALVLFYFLISWPGTLLHLFLLGVFFYLAAFRSQSREEARALGVQGAVFGSVFAVATGLTMRFLPSLVNLTLSFRIALGASLALALGYPLLLLLTQRLPDKLRVLLAPLLLGLIWLALEHFPLTAGAMSTFAQRRDSAISEHSAISFGLLGGWYGICWLALIIAPILVVRKKRWSECSFALIYGLGLTLTWLYTRDFNYYAVLVVAASSAFVVRRFPWRFWTPAVVVALAGISVLPFQLQHPWLTVTQSRGSMLVTDGLSQGAHWLAQVRKKIDPDKEYGLVAPWDLGNILAAIGDTPVGWSQTNSVPLARLFYSEPGDDLYRKLTARPKRPFRFILIPARNVFDKLGTEFILGGGQVGQIFSFGETLEWRGRRFRLPTPNAAFRKLFIVQLYQALARNLGHFRLVFESPGKVVNATRITDQMVAEFNALEVTDQEAEALTPMLMMRNKVLETSRGPLVNPSLAPEVRIFEIVPGAVVTGKAQPNSVVGAFLSVSPSGNRAPEILTWKVYAASDGSFRLRLPYPTDRAMYNVAGTVKVNGTYKVEVDGKQFDLEVPEDAIQGGNEITLGQQ